MASPSQEMNTVREEIGFQLAILASLSGVDDADSKRVRINARREIQLLKSRLLMLQGTCSCVFSSHLNLLAN